MICGLCNKSIFGSYFSDWKGQNSCASHGYPESCSCCPTILRPRYFREVYPGRKVYLSCINNSVTAKELPMVLEWVLERLYDVGFQDVQRDCVKFRIVDAATMNSNYNESDAVGLHYESTPAKRSFRGRYDFNQIVDVLDNLNKIEFAAVLAHEIIHAWQAQNDLADYNEYSTNPKAKSACEGFAQMGSFAIYEWYCRQMPNTSSATFAAFKVDIHLKSDDPDYGIAFRKIHQKFKEIGWLRLIKMARKNQIRDLL